MGWGSKEKRIIERLTKFVYVIIDHGLLKEKLTRGPPLNCERLLPPNFCTKYYEKFQECFLIGH
jgi:hypothetical protein